MISRTFIGTSGQFHRKLAKRRFHTFDADQAGRLIRSTNVQHSEPIVGGGSWQGQDGRRCAQTVPQTNALLPGRIEVCFGWCQTIAAIRQHVAKQRERDKFCIDAPPTGLL
jgi:hypothetical protein